MEDTGSPTTVRAADNPPYDTSIVGSGVPSHFL